MPIIFSTISKHRSGGARVYFQTHDDALLARVTEKVASILGRHQAYVFHEPSEVPAGRTPVVLNLSSGHGDNQPLHQPISFERVQSLHNATDPELRKPVAETLAELQDYLKEVGEPALPKNEGAIPCIPQPAPATQQAGEMEVFGLQWPGEDRINLSTVFDTEAEALEYMQNRCDTPGIRLVRFSSKAPTAQAADSVQEDAALEKQEGEA